MDRSDTTYDMAIAELAIADQNTIVSPRPHIEMALEHSEGALTVFDPDQMPVHNQKATALRDDIKSRLDALSDD